MPVTKWPVQARADGTFICTVFGHRFLTFVIAYHRCYYFNVPKPFLENAD